MIMINVVAYCLLLLSAATSFTPHQTKRTTVARTSSWEATTTSEDSTIPADQDRFYRAVETADFIRSSNSKISLDELDQWATELEQVQDCLFEGGNAELCEKEIQDRMDLAQIFRLEIELKLRLEYLKSNSNLFANDVRKNHDKVERQKFKQALIENRDKMSDRGSDLGLW